MGSNSQPHSLADLLKKLLGHEVAVDTDGCKFTGTVAGVQDHILILCTDKGVVYIKIDEINAVNVLP